MTRLLLLCAIAGGLTCSATTALCRWLNLSGPPVLESPKGPLTINPAYLDFGEVWEISEFEWTLPIENCGTAVTDVTLSLASCWFGTVDPPSHRLASGETGVFRLTLDLRNKCALIEGRPVHEFRVPLEVTTRVGTEIKRQRWELRGRVRRAMAVATRVVDFGRLGPDAIPSERVIPVRLFVPLADLSAEAQSSAFRAAVRSVSDGYELIVQPNHGLPPGRHIAEVLLKPTLEDGFHPLLLKPTLEDGFHPPPTRIQVNYELLPDIQPDAALVLLGIGRIGDVLTGSVTLRSLTGRAIQVTQWSVEPADASTVVKPIVGNLDGTLSFAIHQTVKVEGDAASQIQFVVADGHGSVTVPIEVRYYGQGSE